MGCICIIIYWTISRDTKYVIYTAFTLCLVSMALALPFPESPRLLLSQGKTQEFKEALDMMAKWNGKKIAWEGVDLDG